MINVGLTLGSLIGIVQILGALVYFALSIGQVNAAARTTDAGRIAIAVLQGFLISLLLLISGLILFFQGWRLDPILQLQTLLTTVLIVYLLVLSLRRQV